MFKIIYSVRDVKIQNHVVDLKTIYFDPILPTQSDGTFEIYHTRTNLVQARKRTISKHLKVLGEFFYVVTRVTVKAQRRKNERKIEKAKLLEPNPKPLLPPVNGEV